MKIPLSSITVKKRIRTDTGDLQQLMDSLDRHGLLNPIVVSGNYELIAGQRRYESARRLGWQEIDATIIDADSEAARLELEIEENLHRCDLTAEELAAARERLHKLQHPGIMRRIWNSIARFFRMLFNKLF